MSLFLWMVLGAIAGWLASLVMKDRGYGQMAETVLGIAGAVAGGILTGLLLGMNTASGFNIETLAGAVLGAAFVITASRAYKHTRASA
jgi:uncharacterized membrane protein YeaQ/YmgE (transglycosylase-associated protein family)